MALLKYLKLRDGLPDRRGSLSSSMPSQAIAQANREVQEVIRSDSEKRRGPYKIQPDCSYKLQLHSITYDLTYCARHKCRRTSKQAYRQTQKT